MSDLKILPGKLKGTVSIPPSKSIAHRAVICGALAKGESQIEGIELSDDITATIQAMQALGANIFQEGNRLVIHGIGDASPSSQIHTVDCNESGSTLRFCIPIFSALGFPASYLGRGNLGKRPLQPYFDLFVRQGIPYHTGEDGREILCVQGSLHGEEFVVPGNISSQFVTGLLFALPLLKGEASVRVTGKLESRQYLDLTCDVMSHFGVKVKEVEPQVWKVVQGRHYHPCHYTVEGDYSQSAFFAVANALGSDIKMEGLNPYSLQGDRVAVEVLSRMGAEGGGMKSYNGLLQGVEIDASNCPDIIPELALAACLARGTTTILNAGRLRMKECDRLSAICQELGALGASITEKEDSMVIQGIQRLSGGTVWSHNDHRIAMMLAIASTCCSQPVLLRDYTCVSKSYQRFFDDFAKLGGKIFEQ